MEERIAGFSLKSILLGIGIGIIITSIIGMIYFAGNDPLKNLTEEDIKKLEERYGLVRERALQMDYNKDN